jgi:cellulose synthase/poly-beta-1,6-N-acetylglucosamine synthase-like glycosyltransferase
MAEHQKLSGIIYRGFYTQNVLLTIAEAYRSVTAIHAKPIQISVIIPAHNAAETISATLESLLAQTLNDLKLWNRFAQSFFIK